MTRRIGVARHSSMTQNILLDEPTSGLDPVGYP